MNFDYADRAIQEMNRRNLRSFNKLNLLKFDELNVFKRVKETYEASADLAKKKYREIAIEAFIMALIELGWSRERAEKAAKKKIPEDLILDMLEEVDPLTLYIFTNETERKAQRLSEALLAAHSKRKEIDKALRLWTLQVSAYADRSVLDGTREGYREAGVTKIMWIAQEDEKVCTTCEHLNGQVFDIDELPSRPHFHCRCTIQAVRESV